MVFVLCACLPAFADLPSSVSSILIQGYLTDASGNPVADGSHIITMKGYSSATGGSVLFTQIQSVEVENGIFEFIPNNSAQEDVDLNNLKYYSLSIDGAGESSPRLRLASSAFALFSYNVTGESVSVSNPSGSGVTSIVTASDSVGVVGQGYPYGVLGTCEADNGVGAVGYASGLGGRGAYGKAQASTQTGVMATNIVAGIGAHTGSALNVDGKIIIDREAGTFPKPAGTGTILEGNSYVEIVNPLVSADSHILLTVQDAGGNSSSNTNGGIKVSAIDSHTKFTVKTVDDAVLAVGKQINFSYLIINPN